MRVTKDHPRIPLHILADNIRSVFNVGGILRTADAAGVQRVHICGYTASINHKGVMKSSRGAEQFIPVTNWPDARSAIENLKTRGFSIIGLEPGIGSIDYRLMRYRWPLCVVLGNEATGISPALERLLDDKIEIPMHGGKSSLNVVVALGIVLFHIISTPDRPEPCLPPPRRSEMIYKHVIQNLTSLQYIHGIWTREIDSLRYPYKHIIVVRSSRLPGFRLWCAPSQGGVHVLSNPIQSSEKSLTQHLSHWKIVKTRGVQLHPDIELDGNIPDHDRSLAYYSRQQSICVEENAPIGDIRLNSLVYDLLRRVDTIGPSTVSMLGRYQSSTDHSEKVIHGRYLLDLLLRTHGGPWRVDEILLDPPSVAGQPLVESLLLSIRNALSA